MKFSKSFNKNSSQKIEPTFQKIVDVGIVCTYWKCLLESECVVGCVHFPSGNERRCTLDDDMIALSTWKSDASHAASIPEYWPMISCPSILLTAFVVIGINLRTYSKGERTISKGMPLTVAMQKDF